MDEYEYHYIKTLEQQFLCCYPLNNIKWQTNISWHEQKQLIDCTFNNELNQKYPINTNYQLHFLKKLIQKLEEGNEEVHDEIYEAFCTLNSNVKDDTQFSYKHYSLKNYNIVITLKESKSFVASGTTGLCSWQASSALADWLLHNKEVVSGKNIIELGAGTGLCGFIISKCCKTKSVILTDGSLKVIDVLEINRNINFSSEELKEAKVTITHLPWEDCHLFQMKSFDVILAADVVYDTSEFGNLVKAIEHLFLLRDNQLEMILAATVRNEKTLQEFISLLESKKFKIKYMEVISTEESNLFWDRTTPVKIMRIIK